MIHNKYESSLPDADRSSVRRTCRTKLLNAECNISMANCLKSSLFLLKVERKQIKHNDVVKMIFIISITTKFHTELKVHCDVQRFLHL